MQFQDPGIQGSKDIGGMKCDGWMEGQMESQMVGRMDKLKACGVLADVMYSLEAYQQDPPPPLSIIFI